MLRRQTVSTFTALSIPWERMTLVRRFTATALTALKGTHMSPHVSSLRLISRYLCSSSSPSPNKCAVADPMLFDDPAVFDAPEVETGHNLLRRRVVVYDGVCHLCHSGVKWVIQADKDKKIKFCCVQSKAAEPYIDASGLEREDVLRRFLFVEGPGLYHQGASAGLKVLSYLPPPYSALSALMVIPAPLSDAVYDTIAKQRYNWFGKDDDCLVLKEPELLERFVDWEELLERIRARQF